MENVYISARELAMIEWWTRSLKGLKRGRGSAITLGSGTFNLELYNKIKEAKKPKAK